MEMIEIEAFVAVARHGGLTRAATALQISQPAVSRRLDLLERELGARLFERQRGGMRLTDAGTAFLPHAQQVLASARDGVAAVQALEQEDRGNITLALVGTLASTRLTAELRHFRAAHPRVRLMLRTARSDEVSTMVREGDAHLGLRYFADPHPDLVSLSVAEERLVVVCAADTGPAGREDCTAADLAGMPWVAFPTDAGSSGEGFARVLQQQLLRLGLDRAEIIPVDSLTAQKRLIEAGFALGLLPESSVEEEAQIGTLRRLAVPGMEAAVPIVLVHRHNAYLSGAVRGLLAALTPPAAAASAPEYR
jgi:DNA-binding transcriptional LysR family regulator